MTRAVERSAECVVVVGQHDDERCGKPVVGERGDWPMCAYHMDLFDPAEHCVHCHEPLNRCECER